MSYCVNYYRRQLSLITKHLMLKYFISTCLLLLVSPISHGSLFLTIDVTNGNINWDDSGTGASDIQITQFETTTFFLANKPVLNPNPVSATIVLDMADTLALSTTPVALPPEEILTPINPGQINVDATQSLLTINLGTFYADMGSPTIRFDAGVIDSSIKTYSSFTSAEKSFLSNLQGTDLHLYKLSGGTVSLLDVSIYGPGPAVALNIVPIPEPSTLALLLAAAGLVTCRRRRS